jgi:hypothetical protein
MEDFGYQKEDSSGKISLLTKKTLLIGASLFSLAVFIYIAVNAYYFTYQGENDDIKTIKSPEFPIKVIAENKLNSDLPDAINHSIYEDIFGNNKSPSKGVENIRPPQAPAMPDEKAIAKSKMISNSQELQKLQEKIKTTEKIKSQEKIKTASEQKIIVYDQDKKGSKPSTGNSLADNLAMEEKKKPKEKTEEKPAPIKAKSTSSKRVIRVQIAAMGSKLAAKKYWNDTSKANPKLFSGLKPSIEKVDLKKRGVFYRLQAGDFFNQVQAEEFCTQYTAGANKSRADCIVVE